MVMITITIAISIAVMIMIIYPQRRTNSTVVSEEPLPSHIRGFNSLPNILAE